MPSSIPFKRYVLVLLTTLFMQTPSAHSAYIGLQPDSILASNGDSISFDLVISDLGDFSSLSLGAFDISIGFDESVLSFASYSLDDFLGDINLFEAIDASDGDNGSGEVNVAEVSLLDASVLDTFQPGEFRLATLNFDVTNLAAGAVSQLSVFAGAVLADANGALLLGTTQGSASVNGVVPVPVPGTLFLLAAALLGGLVLKRRQSV
jgi:hypothetical protein